MTAQIQPGRDVDKLVTDLLPSDDDHFRAALVAGLVRNLMEYFLYGQICHDLVTGALDALVCFHFRCLLCAEIDIRFLFSFIEQRQLLCILKDYLCLFALLSVELLFKPGDTFFQYGVFVLQRG